MTPAEGSGGRLVLFGGQSNMLGHRLATDGDKPVSPYVLAWDNGGADGTWAMAELGRAPFNPQGEQPNNAALHFAVRLAEHTGEPVHLVGRPVNGSSILSWQGGADDLSRLVAECTHALASAELRGAGVERVDTMLWHQGETDEPGATMVPWPRLQTLPDYEAAFRRLRATLARQPWWTDETRFIAGELVRDGWLSARNDFYSAGALNGPHDAVVSSEELGHVGDAAHFDGRALQTLGERMFDAWLDLDATG